MSKSLLLVLLVILVYTTRAADVQNYTAQGNIKLVPGITNLGYSPNQKHLVVLSDSIPATDFLHYYGLRLNMRQNMTIVDAETTSVKPSTFAFSKDGTWLIVGTSWGAVYGYQVNDGELSTNYKYKKHIGAGEVEDAIKSISFSANGKIAVAAKDLIVVLTVDESATDFHEDFRYNCSNILSSVAWKHNSENILIVGGFENAFFHIIDITATPIKPEPILDPAEQTLSIGVFSDAKQTILQGRLNDPIRIFEWDETKKNYISVGTIDNTIKASQISITQDGTYFAAEINSAEVIAWKSNLQTNLASNLKNHSPQAINPQVVLPATPGKNLALSNDGNRILIIGQTQTANKFRICEQNQWYDYPNKFCQPCVNGCGSCFNTIDCEACPDNTTYVDPSNQCKACSEIKNGCKECQSSTTCDACNTNEKFNPTPDPIDNSCKCAPQYFLENNQCKQCRVIDFCRLCESGPKCTQCTGQNHINKTAVNGACVCDDGWYLDGTCKDCTLQAGCLKCDSSTNCIECDSLSNWIRDPSGKCICGPGYWLNATICEPCNSKTPNCTACQQDGVCTQCIATRVVSDDKTKCVCEGHRYDDTTTQKCELCDPKMKCLHCDPTGAHTCTECDYIDGHRKKDPVEGKCECQPGFIENQDEFCTQCSIPGCEICAVLEECSRCFTEKNFNPDPVDKTCVCKDGFLPKKDKQSCSTCDIQIPGCTQCQDLEVCQACSQKNHFEPHPNNQSRCSCAATYFLNDTLCELCSLEYKNCEECTQTQCMKCQPNYLPNDDNKKCFTCAQAIPGCKTCKDLKTCIQCNAQKFWQPSSDNKACSCKLSYYQNGTECKWCASQFPYCSNCSAQGCFSCQQTFTYNPELKTCICGDEKEIKDGKCEDQSGLSALAIIAIIVGILAVAGAAVAIIKCFKKRQSPLEDGEYEALEGEKNN